MKLYFVRHGQGQHIMEPPHSYQMKDPSLTDVGKWQASNFSERFPVNSDDVFVISPLRRTIQTALYWGGDVECRRTVSPLVGPRLYPLLPLDKAYGCDTSLSPKAIAEEFPQLEMTDVPLNVWERELIQFLKKAFLIWLNSLLLGAKSIKKYTLFPMAEPSLPIGDF